MVDSGKVCLKRVLRRCRKQRLGKLGMVKHLRASNYRKLLPFLGLKEQREE